MLSDIYFFIITDLIISCLLVHYNNILINFDKYYVCYF